MWWKSYTSEKPVQKLHSEMVKRRALFLDSSYSELTSFKKAILHVSRVYMGSILKVVIALQAF